MTADLPHYAQFLQMAKSSARGRLGNFHNFCRLLNRGYRLALQALKHLQGGSGRPAQSPYFFPVRTKQDQQTPRGVGGLFAGFNDALEKKNQP